MQRLEKILAQTAAPKVPEWPSYGNFCEIIQNPHFLKKCKGGTKRNFSKFAQKVTLAWKGQEDSGANGLSSNNYALKEQRLEKILAQSPASKVPELPSYGNSRKVTQNPHFLKKCKGGTKGNVSKIAQKVAIVWKAQKHSGANGLSSNYYALKMQRLEKILEQTAALKVPEWPSYGNSRKVTQNPHYLKKCKGETKKNFSKMTKK